MTPRQIIADFWACAWDLSNSEALADLLHDAADAAGYEVLDQTWTVTDNGVSGVFIAGHGRLTVRAVPEIGYLTVDLVSDGEPDAWLAFDVIKNIVGAGSVSTCELVRDGCGLQVKVT